MTTPPAIELSGLVKRYGPVTAVDRLDLVVPRGQIVALLGPNGAGKSTATEMILGLTRPDAGRVRVFDADPVAAMRRGDVGAMLQNGPLLWDTTVAGLLGLMHGLQAHPLSVAEVIARSGIEPILSTSTNKLSGGQAQRVRFALALLGDPRLLLLDEPTVGLDVEARGRFWASMADLAADGRTVVFATHYLDEADEFADRIVVLDRGRLIADGTGTHIKGLVGGRHVTFSGPERDWSTLPGVVAAARVGGRVTLTCSDADAALRALVASTDAAAVRDIETASPTLEDAFLSLVSPVTSGASA